MSLAEQLDPRLAIGANNPPPLAEILAEKHAALLAEVDVILDRAASQPRKIDNDIALGRLGDVVKDARKLAKRIDTKRGEEVEPHLTAQRETNAFFKTFTERLEASFRALEAVATDYQNRKAAEERRRLEEAARKAREEQDRQREIAERAAAENRQGAALKHDDRAEEEGARADRLEAAAQASAADLTRVRTGSGTVATTRSGWDFSIEDLDAIPLDKLRPYLPRDAIDKAIRTYVRMGGRELAGTKIFSSNRASFR